METFAVREGVTAPAGQSEERAEGRSLCSPRVKSWEEAGLQGLPDAELSLHGEQGEAMQGFW